VWLRIAFTVKPQNSETLRAHEPLRLAGGEHLLKVWLTEIGTGKVRLAEACSMQVHIGEVCAANYFSSQKSAF
jgi:hypothetical protein